MDRKDFVKSIKDFESSHSVDEWMIKGLHVWPIIKMDAFFKFNNKNKEDISTECNKKNKLKKILTLILKVLTSLWHYSKFLLSSRFDQPVILFSDSAGHRIKHNGEFINRYYQPIFDYMEEKYPKYEHLTVSDDTVINRYDKSENIIFLERLKYAAYIISRFKKNKKKTTLPDYDLFINELIELGIINNKQRYKKHILKRVKAIEAYSWLAKKIIDKYNIQCVFELCYYSASRYGLNFAAKKNKLPVYEIQHGGMGPEHLAYSGFQKIPDSGYNVLPETFWLWDESSFDLLDQWVSKQKFHKAVIGGNPWLDFVLGQNKGHYLFPKNKKIILYTLQYREVDDYILEAIKKTPEEYEWWFRLHPRKTDAKPGIENQLKLHNIKEQVEIEKATSYPLPVILQHCVIHLSGFSGSIIEAAQVGTMSIILDPIGVSSFKSYIASGEAVAQTSRAPEQLMASIKEHQQEDKTRCEESLVTCYKEIIDDLLRK